MKLKIFLVSLLMVSVVHANEIRFMTYNIAALPSIFGHQIGNGDFLKPNTERGEEIAKVINGWIVHPSHDFSPPQVIAFEEAFDHNMRNLLKDRLSANYPYNSGDYGEKFLNAGSGLLLFSQYPIVEITFHAYDNMMTGEESLANKGYITAKLKYNDHYFITVIITHLEAGGALWKEEQSKHGTTSVRRGVQMGEINNELATVAPVSPKGNGKLNFLKSFVLGDFNATLDGERQQKSISTGMSDNGFYAGQIKYPGQFALFSTLNNTVPDNFMSVRILPTKKGEGKPVDPVLVAQAVQLNRYTGTTMPDDLLKANKNNGVHITRQQTEHKIIDGMFCSRLGVDGDFRSMIVDLNESSQYPYLMSDHFAVMGKFSFTAA